MKTRLAKQILSILAPWMASIPVLAVFRWLPGFSNFWMDHVALPLSRFLHRISGSVPFPILEIMVIGAIIVLPLSLLTVIIRRQIYQWIKCLSRSVCIIVLFFGLLWFPAYQTDTPSRYPFPNSMQLT